MNYSAGLGPHSVAVGDVNDGKPDLIVANNCVSSNCAQTVASACCLATVMGRSGPP